MYKRILVLLDDSKLAECVLPHAEELAKNCDPQYSQTDAIFTAASCKA